MTPRKTRVQTSSAVPFVARAVPTALPPVTANDPAPPYQFGLSEIDGEPRIRDIDLAERLGFDRPRDIRKLIERNMVEVASFGICATVAQNHGGGRGRPTAEFYLNEEQALLVAVLSNAPFAPSVRSALIRTFVAYRRGQLEMPSMLDGEGRKVIGGIVKAIVHKEITEAIPGVVELLVEQRLASDPRIAALDYVSVTDLLDKEWKVPSKGRRSIQRRVLNRLKAHCLSNGIRGSKAPYSGTWIFPRHEAGAFLRDHCGPMIRDHIDKVNGQGRLRLVA